MPFTIQIILALKIAVGECGDFFELFPKWKQLVLFLSIHPNYCVDLDVCVFGWWEV